MVKRKIKMQILFFGVMALTVLCGCGSKEISKTIVLPSESKEEDGDSGIEIKEIEEYTWEIALWHNPYEKNIRQADISPGGDFISYRVTSERASWMEKYEELAVAETLRGSEMQITEKKIKLWVYSDSDDGENLQWAWSGDGKKIVVWGEVASGALQKYDSNITYNGCILQVYDSDMVYNDKLFSSVEKKIGDERVGRELFPNQDASLIYMVEEAGAEEETAIDGDASAGPYFRHWIIETYPWKMTDLGLKPASDIQPIRYTEDGLLARDGDGMVSVYRELPDLSKKEDLFQLEDDEAQVYMCNSGDHIFVLETDADGEKIEVRGIRLQEGEVLGQQILYKGNASDDMKAAISPEDDSIMIWSSESLEENRSLVKITELKY